MNGCRLHGVMVTTSGASHHVLICGGSQQPAKGDDGRETGKVHEEEGGQTLDVQPVLVVAEIQRQLASHIHDQPPKDPAHTPRHTGVQVY